MTEMDGASVRHEFFFQEGAPNVALTGLDLRRALLNEPGEGPQDETELKWAVAGAVTPPGSQPAFLVAGDLQARRSAYFVGCQVVGFLDFRSPEDAPSPDDDGVKRALASWASSALYDFAASHARTLIGAAVGCEIEIPRVTPIADLESVIIQVGEPDSAEDADSDSATSQSG